MQVAVEQVQVGQVVLLVELVAAVKVEQVEQVAPQAVLIQVAVLADIQ